jgi:hypothetical protein
MVVPVLLDLLAVRALSLVVVHRIFGIGVGVKWSYQCHAISFFEALPYLAWLDLLLVWLRLSEGTRRDALLVLGAVRV